MSQKKRKRRKQNRYKIKTSFTNRTAELIKFTCENCGGPLRRKGKIKAVCQHCGQVYIVEEAEDVIVRINRRDKEQMPEGRQAGKNIKTICEWLVAILVVAALAVATTTFYNRAVTRQQMAPEKKLCIKAGDRDLMKIFCEEVFEEEYRKISEEQLENLKYIEYKGARVTGNIYKLQIKYSFSDYLDCENEKAFRDTLHTWNYETADLNGDFLNCEMLTGLTGIGVDFISEVKLSKNCEIYYLHVGDTPAKLVSEMGSQPGARVEPGQIKVLHIQHRPEIGTYGDTSLEKIEAFTNLEELVYRDGYQELPIEIVGLDQCRKLRKLHLDCGDRYTGLELLKGIETLTSLYINGMPLEECEFLKEMPRLRELSVMAGVEGDLSMLLALPNLQKLHFLDYEMIAPEILLALPGLEDLQVNKIRVDEIQCLQQLTNLKKLKLGMEGSPLLDCDVSFLADMPKLTDVHLSFNSGTMSTGVYGVDKLLGKENLKSLKLIGVSAFGSRLHMNPETLTENPSLEKLMLYSCYVLPEDMSPQEPVFEEGGRKIPDREKADYSFLTKYPNLKHLSLMENMLSDISFVKGLQQLETLTIRDSDVADYTPLTSCPGLKVIYLDSDQEETARQQVSQWPEEIEMDTYMYDDEGF